MGKQNYVKKIASYIIKYFIPEILILKKDINWQILTNYKSNCKISNKSVINSPFHLNKISLDDFGYIRY